MNEHDLREYTRGKAAPAIAAPEFTHEELLAMWHQLETHGVPKLESALAKLDAYVQAAQAAAGVR